MNARRKIKLMADYDSFPLWTEDGTNLDPRTLPLREETVARLFHWAETYDRTLNRADPARSGFRSDQERAAFEEERILLLHALRSELPDNEVVSPL